jgi:PAS domain S-box-containing protein
VTSAWRRLDVRILLILSLILTTLVAVFGWRVSRRQGEISYRSVVAEARLLSQIHANDAAHFLVIREYAGLEEHLAEVARMPDILGIEVYDASGRGICAMGRQMASSEPVPRPYRSVGEIPTGDREVLRREGDRLVLWTPVEAGGRLGWLRLEYSLAAVRRLQAEVWRTSAFMGGLLALAGTVLMYLVLRPPLNAVRRLAGFARELNRRKGDQVTAPGLSLETDELAEALNAASSELAASERRLIEEQERLAVTLGSLGDGVMACDQDGRITLMNRVAESLTGWSAVEALGRPLGEVLRLAEGRTGEPARSPVGEGPGEADAGRTGQVLLEGRDGGRRPVSDSRAPILSAAGEPLGMVVLLRDESARIQAEQKRLALEEQLRQAQKMEAVGQMAGGIAHDFNNILTAIIGYTSMFLDQARGGGAGQELAERILRAAERAAGLTRSLLAFSRKQKMSLKPVDLNDILRNQEHLLRRLIGEDIILRVEPSAQPLVAQVDAGQIEQVVLNLVTNARDAMPRGGLLSISAQAATLEGPAFVPPDQGATLSGPCVLLCVSDTGAGMDAATLAKIFDPFFTTKAVGKGTGLGLAIVHGIVEQHGGLIRVYSHPGIGTTFKIYLPRLAEGELAPASLATPQVRGGTERILLVEDEAEVRRVVRMMLEAGGYRVVEAGSGEEALALLAGEAREVPLVISDVIMPGITGKELRDRVVASHPGTRVLYLSGYTADIIQNKGFLASEADLLMKPFSSADLLARVRARLDAS